MTSNIDTTYRPNNSILKYVEKPKDNKGFYPTCNPYSLIELFNEVYDFSMAMGKTKTVEENMALEKKHIEARNFAIDLHGLDAYISMEKKDRVTISFPDDKNKSLLVCITIDIRIAREMDIKEGDRVWVNYYGKSKTFGIERTEKEAGYKLEKVLLDGRYLAGYKFQFILNDLNPSNKKTKFLDYDITCDVYPIVGYDNYKFPPCLNVSYHD